MAKPSGIVWASPRELVRLIPSNLLVVWVPSLVMFRLGQLWRVVTMVPPPTTGVSTLKALPREVWGYGAELGIWPGKSFAYTTCPTCQRPTVALELVEGGWACWRERYPGGSLPWLEHTLAGYAFGLRIGLANVAMRRMRKQVLPQLAILAAKARSIETLRLLACASLVAPRLKADWPPLSRWKRKRRGGGTLRRAGEGPLHRAAAPHLIPAMLDSLLAPAAFRDRFLRGAF